jgi:hypothetical protein
VGRNRKYLQVLGGFWLPAGGEFAPAEQSWPELHLDRSISNCRRRVGMKAVDVKTHSKLRCLSLSYAPRDMAAKVTALRINNLQPKIQRKLWQ